MVLRSWLKTFLSKHHICFSLWWIQRVILINKWFSFFFPHTSDVIQPGPHNVHSKQNWAEITLFVQRETFSTSTICIWLDDISRVPKRKMTWNKSLWYQFSWETWGHWETVLTDWKKWITVSRKVCDLLVLMICLSRRQVSFLSLVFLHKISVS